MKLRKFVDAFLRTFLVIVMLVLVVDVLWQVFSRYIIGVPSAFTDELAGYLLIWVGLGGAAYATGTKQHLAIDLLPSKLPPEKRRYLDVVVNVLVFIFALLVMVIGGIWLVYTRFYLGQVSSALQLPLGVVYLILPFSGIIICYYVIDDIINLFKMDPNELYK